MRPDQYRPPSDVYTDIMHDAFKQASHPGEADKPFQEHFLHTIAGMDWYTLGKEFDTREFDSPDGDDDFTPRDQVEHLTKLAFDDARRLINIARGSLPEDVQNDPSLTRQILVNSERELLQLARLGDMQKSLFLNRLEIGPAHLITRDVIPELGNEPPLLFDGTALSWHPAVKDRIKERIDPAVHPGCPALKRADEYEGRKMPLIYAFWRTLLDATYSTQLD